MPLWHKEYHIRDEGARGENHVMKRFSERA
jgi:hypothetical protein